MEPGRTRCEQATTNTRKQNVERVRTAIDRLMRNPLVGVEWDYRHSNHALQRPFKGARRPHNQAESVSLEQEVMLGRF